MSTPKKHRSLCKYEFCEEQADKHRKSGLCEEHTRHWINSPEWREAQQDENVRFWFGLRADKEAMRIVNGKYKKKWLKRMAAPPADDAEEGK